MKSLDCCVSLSARIRLSARISLSARCANKTILANKLIFNVGISIFDKDEAILADSAIYKLICAK